MRAGEERQYSKKHKVGKEVCVDEPTVEGGETNWDSGKVWLVGSIVNVTCESDLRLLPDGNQTQQIQWTDQG
ncbi:hypothetical protein Pcinc_004111 [Petrolisthes cinctipes]|nr:hypothetical protein Pcinc_004111 [Petrolisthes cinctipes]